MANVYPNSTTDAFCKWLLANSLIRLTAPRKIQVQNVQTAANTNGYVTQLYFEEFVQYTNRFYEQWLQYLNGQPSSPVSASQDALTTAWLAVVSSPAQQTIYAVDVFFKQLRNDGNLGLDYFYLFAQDKQANAVYNLMNPTLYTITEAGTPTWTANQGYTGNGTSMYLKTNYIESVNGVNVTSTSECLGVYTRQTVATAGKYVLGAGDSSNQSWLAINYSGGNMEGVLAHSSGIVNANTNTKGCFCITKPSALVIQNWINGAQLGTQVVTTGASVTKMDFIMCYNNNGTPLLYDTNQYAAAWKGSGAINQVLLNSAINTLMTNLGAHY